MFFGENRKNFLEFLRNLTPQILFLSISIIIHSQLDFSQLQFTYKGFINAITFYSCIGIFIGASFANMTLFLENSIQSNKKLDRVIKPIVKSKITRLKKILAGFAAAWKHNKIAFSNVVLVMIIIEFAFIVVVVVSAQTALASPLLTKRVSAYGSSTQKNVLSPPLATKQNSPH